MLQSKLLQLGRTESNRIGGLMTKFEVIYTVNGTRAVDYPEADDYVVTINHMAKFFMHPTGDGKKVPPVATYLNVNSVRIVKS